MPRWGCTVVLVVASLLFTTPEGALALEEKLPVPTQASLRSPDSPPLPGGLNCAMSYSRRNVGFDWYDTSDAWVNDEVRNDDIDVFNLPFPFIYYGMRADWVGVTDDGWLSFFEGENGNFDWQPDPIPDTGVPYGVIAPLWIDFDPEAGYTVPDQRVMQLKTFGSSPYRAWVLTWENFPRYGEPETSYTFQVVLYETTNRIRFQWLEVIDDWKDPDVLMSIGIENEAGTLGDQYAHNEEMDLEGKAIEYRPSLPSLVCDSATPVTPGVLTGEPMGPSNDRVLYGCSEQVFLGSERLYSFTLDAVTLVDIQVTPQDAGHDLRAFVMSRCDLCNCVQGDSPRVRTALGPGDYYLVVDGLTAADNGPYDLSFETEQLMGQATGQIMHIDGNQCELTMWLDRFADGRGVFITDGWFNVRSDRTYHVLRQDGDMNKVYGTNYERSSCNNFTRMVHWVDDNTDKAVVYWQTPEADIVQTIFGRETDGCCGALSVTRVYNTDDSNHFYEFRSLYATDFGPPELACLASEERVEAGPLHVEPHPADFAFEQDLTCEPTSVPPGICGLACDTPVELKTADTLEVKLVAQYLSEATPDAVRGEWIDYFDVNRVCDDIAPEPWIGGFLPTPEAIAACGDENGLLYSTRLPAGNGRLQPGESATVVKMFGDGCRLDPDCSTCLATADLVVGTSNLCLGDTTTLDGSNSEALGCQASGGTVTFEWLRDGQPTAETGDTYLVDEATPGEYTYTLQLSCQPPPQGLECTDTREAMIGVHDCASCNIDAQIGAVGSTLCLGGELELDASASVITECPGTLSYSWTRDGEELTGEESPQLFVSEATAGDYEYGVTVVCNPPPVGLSCQGGTNLMVSAFDCSACNIEAVIEAPVTSLQVGESTELNAESLSTVNDCPGTVSYAWYRDGDLLAGETSPTLVVMETQGGDYEFTVTVTCSPPPAGLDCESTSPPVLISYSEGPVPNIGNTLRVIKSPTNHDDVHLEWGEAGAGLTYDLLRVETRTELVPPQPEPPYQEDLAAAQYDDLGGVTALPPYFYRVRAVDGTGLSGNY